MHGSNDNLQMGKREEATNRLLEGRKVRGTLCRSRRENTASREVKRALHDRLVIPKE